MTPFPIVKDLDVLENIQPGLISGGVVTVKGQLGFECTEKTFLESIIITVAFAAHTTHHLGLCQQGLIIFAGILTTV